MRGLVRLQEVANNKLKQKLSEVARALEDEDKVCFELITTTGLTSSAQKDLATFQEQLAEEGWGGNSDMPERSGGGQSGFSAKWVLTFSNKLHQI